jgi:hypothetical protein
MQFLLKQVDDRGIGLAREQPTCLGSDVRFSGRHDRNLWVVSNADNHHSAAYSSTPHPSQISVDPVFVMTLRRWSGSIVSHDPQELLRSGNTA